MPRAYFRWPRKRTIPRFSGFVLKSAVSYRSTASTFREASRKPSVRVFFEIRLDSNFAGVIEGCASGTGERARTWINEPIRRAYAKLFEIGHCHTVEAWYEGKLAGGLYGVTLGRAFFGESMFTRKRDASKVCLAYLVQHLSRQGFVLLDTQFTTPHLERFGALEVPRKEYEEMLERALEGIARF